MNDYEANPYAAPSVGAEQGSTRFELSDELRKLISTTATLMMVAGVVQLLPSIVALIRGGFSAASLLSSAAFGVVPAFIAIAGFSLRSAAQEGSLDTLLAGFRQLYVAFLVKGVVLLLVVGFFLLGLAAMFLGVGIGFASLFS